MINSKSKKIHKKDKKDKKDKKKKDKKDKDKNHISSKKLFVAPQCDSKYEKH